MSTRFGRLGLLLAAAALPAGAHAAEPATAVEEVIVTGTRMSGLRAVDSPAPIQVIDSSALTRSGAPNGLSQALAARTPSFNAQAVGGDTANLTLSARLRGLSPNHTLVLINGKRRHGTSNLAILSSVFQGGAAADLNLIPASAIDHIEVLQDGAAAQYGSDAIAGVINIILKRDSSGGHVALSGGGYDDGDGETGVGELNFGARLGENAFLNLTAEAKIHDYTNRGGPDQRVVRAVESGAHPEWANLRNYPVLNKIFGDARVEQVLLAFNAGAEVGGAELYAFGTFGRKHAGGWANFRLPTRLPLVYPEGFDPIDEMQQRDQAITAGVRGAMAGWSWDLSTTYGRDHASINVTRSANIDLYNDTGFTPFDFHAGDFIASQWTSTLDLVRSFDVGLAGPLVVAVGGEHRHEAYQIKAGDPASRYKAGSQSYPGFALTDASRHTRRNWAAYLDLAIRPVPDLLIDLAGRYEHFSDFGSTTVGKLTARYDLTPAMALRGTVSSGFRAPTLAESYYSATNVQPNSAFVQLPPNAPAAALIGIEPLEPEKSVNLSAGLVAHVGRAVVTLDAYQIKVRDRVVGSGTLYGTYAGVPRSAAVNAAIVANGNVLENVPFTGINVFSNGLDTRTRGAELVVTLASDLGDLGAIDWTLAANVNKTRVTAVRTTPPQLAASGQSLFDLVAISTLETASPRYKVVLGGVWRHGRWTVDLRESFYGDATRWSDPGDGTYYLDEQGKKAVTDLEVSYAATSEITLTLGGANLFDVYPDKVNAAGLAASGAAGNPAVEIYPAFSAIGINGGYYYGRVRLRF